VFNDNVDTGWNGTKSSHEYNGHRNERYSSWYDKLCDFHSSRKLEER
jgi:hypothetical protein